MRQAWLPALLLILSGCERAAVTNSATEAELDDIGGRNRNAAVTAAAGQRANAKAAREGDAAGLDAAQARGRAAATETLRRSDAEEAARVEGNR